jgi:drug/metabolite transporter (DMT)-like permease
MGFRPALALLYLIGAHIGFTLVDAAGKYLATDMGVPLITLVRHLVQALLMLVIFAPAMGFGLIKTQYPGLQIARGLALAGFTLFFFTALRYLPQAEATAINFMTPFGVLLLAAPLLGERVSWRSWAGAGLGFVGLLIVVRPGSGLPLMGVLFAVLTVICNVAFQMLTRRLSTLENQNATIFLTAIVGIVSSIFLLPLQGVWGGWPADISPWQWVVLISTGVSGLLSQWCLIRAYFWSSASFIAPLVFLQMFWAAAAGWWFFGQFPDALGMTGIIIIVLAGGLTMWARNRTAA